MEASSSTGAIDENVVSHSEAPDLMSPWQMGSLRLRNRVVMAPMTRLRADADGVLIPAAAEYYRQRASAGLIVSEGAQPSEFGRGYLNTPGIHNDFQQDAWAKVVAAVHKEGGLIFCQLMHTGRIGHPLLLPDGRLPVAPSAITPVGEAETLAGMRNFVAPRALDTDELPGVAAEFAAAAARAVEAGMDGVELHGANGYLLHQFLSDNTNHRSDRYGGTPAGRARFVTEVVEAVAARIGADRVGLRISPGGKFNDMSESDPVNTYIELVEQLRPLRIAYLHTLRRRSNALHEALRQRWPTTYILNTGWMGSSDKDVLEPFVQDGSSDLVSVGRLFLSNPDLIARWRDGRELAAWDEELYYQGGLHGYTDYPAWSRSS